MDHGIVRLPPFQPRTTLLNVVIETSLARKIHDFRSTKGLAMVQIRYLGRFETKSEAFACPNIPQQTVFFFQIFLIDRWSRSLTNGRAVPMAERFCSRLPSGAWS